MINKALSANQAEYKEASDIPLTYFKEDIKCIITDLYHCLDGANSIDEFRSCNVRTSKGSKKGASVGNGDIFRKLHDLLGWMARPDKIKDPKRKLRGLCGGALYRSEKFIRIDRLNRVGTNPRNMRIPIQNIHIEHAVPIKLSKDILWNNKAKIGNPHDLFNTIIKYSVLTAVLNIEERKAIDKTRVINGIEKHWGKNHPCFNGDGHLLDDCNRPFLRYQGADIKIYRMDNGTIVDQTKFTFDDHYKFLKQYDAFNWKFFAN